MLYDKLLDQYKSEYRHYTILRIKGYFSNVGIYRLDCMLLSNPLNSDNTMEEVNTLKILSSYIQSLELRNEAVK